MSDLNKAIDRAQPFMPDGTQQVTVDQTAQCSLGLDMARRQAERASVEPPKPVQLAPITPLAN